MVMMSMCVSPQSAAKSAPFRPSLSQKWGMVESCGPSDLRRGERSAFLQMMSLLNQRALKRQGARR